MQVFSCHLVVAVSHVGGGGHKAKKRSVFLVGQKSLIQWQFSGELSWK